MAISDIQTNNKLIKFTQQINREWVRENMFSPYMGEDVNAIIRKRMELKTGGEVMNIPLVTRLQGVGVSTGPLVGNEEKIDDYGMRIWLEWIRNAVVTTKAEQQKDSADIFGEAKPLLSDWLVRGHPRRDHRGVHGAAIGKPAGGRRSRQRHSVRAVHRGATQHVADRQPRPHPVRCHDGQLGDRSRHLAGQRGRHRRQVHGAQPVTAQAYCDGANPRIRPYKTRSGYEYFVAFHGAQHVPRLKISSGNSEQGCAGA